MRRLCGAIRRVAPTRATVLVHGETGTGKELVATSLHRLSDRADGPFVPVHCSALPESLIEGELFGHTRGAFTGASRDRPGLIESAHRGTLFLDEVSTLTPAIQVKLLRVLQDRRVKRVGARRSSAVDFRLVAATNEDLEAMVRQGSFREDLYYRLDVIRLEVPPLRHRREDIALLSREFWARFAREDLGESSTLPAELEARIVARSWPGNVRELENFIERAVILYPHHVPESPLVTGGAGGSGSARRRRPGGRGRPGPPPPPDDGESPDGRGRPAPRNAEAAGDGEPAVDRYPTLAQVERRHVLRTLARCDGNRSETARRLGIDRRTLYRKLKRYHDRDA
jgi:DNA-binding NtrC family response regulator